MTSENVPGLEESHETQRRGTNTRMLNLNYQGQHLTQIAIWKQPICPPPMPGDPRFWPPASDEPKESSSRGTKADSKPLGQKQSQESSAACHCRQKARVCFKS